MTNHGKSVSAFMVPSGGALDKARRRRAARTATLVLIMAAALGLSACDAVDPPANAHEGVAWSPRQGVYYEP